MNLSKLYTVLHALQTANGTIDLSCLQPAIETLTQEIARIKTLTAPFTEEQIIGAYNENNIKGIVLDATNGENLIKYIRCLEASRNA
jgi:hypothetical protein